MSRRLSGAPPELGPEALEQIERELRESRRSARVAAIEPLEEGGAEGLAVFGPEENPAALALVAGNEEEQGLDPAQELNSEESEVDSVLSDLLEEFVDCEEVSDPPLAFAAVVGTKSMASSSGVAVAEMIGTRASVGSILVNTYSGARGYAFSNWKRAVKQLLEHERPKSDKAVYSATTQLAHIEGTITPYSKAAAWFKWVRKTLTYDMALADINHFPLMKLVPYVEGMEDDWTTSDVPFDFNTAKDMEEWFTTDADDTPELPEPRAVAVKKATKDGRLLSPHDGVIEKFWFYAERKFGRAETTAVIAFTAMKQGQPLEGEQVSSKETELEFASRVKAHHASLRKEYTDQQAMQIYLDGLNDQTLAHWVAMRAGLLELSKQTVTNAATEIEQMLKYKVGAEHLQLLREARQKKAAKPTKVAVADVPASDPKRHPEAPCYLHPDKKHVNGR